MTTATRTNQKPITFYIRPFRESLMMIKAKLSGSVYRLIEFMSASCTFGDEVVFMPPVKDLAEILDMGLSTIYNCLKRIEEVCPFLRFQKTSVFLAAYRTDPKNPKNFFDFQNQELFPIQKNQFQKYRKNSQNLENNQLELPLDKGSESPQTLQKDHTLQTGGGVDQKINNKQEENNLSDSKPKNNSFTCLPDHKPKTNPPPAVAQKKYKIPEELAERLRMAKIPLSEQVLVKISQHHISQAYGAVTHVENTWTTIKDAKAVFLYQLPKQPIEKLGQRHDEELLEKQKQELKVIEEEIARGVPRFTETPAFKALKEKLTKRTGQSSS